MWRTRSPCRWPSLRRPSVKPNSPRSPRPASTPGQEVTSSVICSLAVRGVLIDVLLPAPGVVLRISSRLQAQVSLKSRLGRGSMSRVTTLLTIGEVSHRSGVATSALRFYEERGLITSERTGSGHRRYPRPVLRRIAFIVFAQRIGLSLDEIGGELAKLPEN